MPKPSGKILFLHTSRDRWRIALELASKIGSLLVLVVYSVVFVYASWPINDGLLFIINFVRFLLSQVVWLALIWFPEEAGNFVGYITRHPRHIDSASPAILIAFMGWVLLLAPIWIPLIGFASVPWVFKF